VWSPHVRRIVALAGAIVAVLALAAHCLVLADDDVRGVAWAARPPVMDAWAPRIHLRVYVHCAGWLAVVGAAGLLFGAGGVGRRRLPRRNPARPPAVRPDLGLAASSPCRPH
jgi:hypothetical protein